MRTKIPFLLFSLLLLSGMLTAQSRAVIGTVTSSDDGQPLIGVNILVVGSSVGTITDTDGRYTLELPDGADLLQFSYTGFQPQEVSVGLQSRIDVIMAPGELLEEVVVIGYGAQKKVNLTGAVSVVQGEEITKRPVFQTSNALQGISPGVTVRTFGGGPGDDGGEVRIRGLGTLNNNDPLVLIDGVVGAFSDVDPNNIESISVLKDAASAAIYGSRASGGVILITTKRAKAGGFSVTYDGYVGVQSPVDLPEYLDATEFLKLYNKASVNSTGNPQHQEAFINDYAANHSRDPDHFPDVDWEKETLVKNPRQQFHSLSINAGSDRVRVLGVLGFQDQQGLIQNSEYQRYAVRLNTDIKASDRMRFFADLNLKLSDDQEPGSGEGGIFIAMNRIWPTLPALYSDGSWGEGWNGDNPLALSKASGLDKTKTNLAILNLGFNFQPLKGWNIDATYAPRLETDFRKRHVKRIEYLDIDTKNIIATNPNITSLFESYNRNLDTYGKLQTSYEQTIHKLTYKILAGVDQTLLRTDNFSASRVGFAFPDFGELNAGSEDLKDNSGSASELALLSYFGRLNLNWSEKYLFEANFRYDGTSRFAEGNRWGFFPSLSVGWRVSEEPFLQNLDAVDNLKFRFSWGQLGNQNTNGRYPTTSSINLNQAVVFSNGGPQGAASIAALVNPLLTWETTTQTDFGMDLGLFNNKLEVVFDYYWRYTNDILISLPVPQTSGFSSIQENAAEVENKGWDLGVNFNDRKGDFNYSLGFNLSDVRNKVLNLLETGPYISGFQIIQEGEEMNSIFGFQSDGFFQNQAEIDAHAKQFGVLRPGDIRYVDQNSDGVINAEDRVIIGSRIPRWTYGANLNFGYKGLDLSVFLQGIGRYNGYQSSHAAWPFENSGSGKAQIRHADTWSTDNPNARYPNWYIATNGNNYQRSSFWATDASYFKLKNFVLGYTFPQQFAGNKYFKKLRVYISGQNVITLDKMEGFDPESPLGDANFYPQVSVYTFGVNANF